MADLLSDPMPDGVRGLMHSLIGCDWGRTIGTANDPEPCMAQATQRVALHDPPGAPHGSIYKLCPEHLAVVLSETTPTAPPERTA